MHGIIIAHMISADAQTKTQTDVENVKWDLAATHEAHGRLVKASSVPSHSMSVQLAIPVIVQEAKSFLRKMKRT